MKKTMKKTKHQTSIYDSSLSAVDLHNSLTLKFTNVQQEHFELEFENIHEENPIKERKLVQLQPISKDCVEGSNDWLSRLINV